MAYSHYQITIVLPACLPHCVFSCWVLRSYSDCLCSPACKHFDSVAVAVAFHLLPELAITFQPRNTAAVWLLFLLAKRERERSDRHPTSTLESSTVSSLFLPLQSSPATAAQSSAALLQLLLSSLPFPPLLLAFCVHVLSVDCFAPVAEAAVENAENCCASKWKTLRQCNACVALINCRIWKRRRERKRGESRGERVSAQELGKLQIYLFIYLFSFSLHTAGNSLFYLSCEKSLWKMGEN